MTKHKSIRSLYAHAKDTPDRRVLDSISRDFSWHASGDERWKLLLSREWLATNGLGGYASGTVGGTLTRRFHGLLIAALPTPHGRTMMLNDLVEEVTFADESTFALREDEPGNAPAANPPLQSFRLEAGIPAWTFNIHDCVLEKRVHLVHSQNTTHLTYTWRGPDSAALRLRPAVHFRPHEGKLSGLSASDYLVSQHDHWFQIGNGSDLPLLRMAMSDGEATFVSGEKTFNGVQFQIEKERGYDYTGELWSPGYFELQLTAPQQVTFTASTEDWDILEALDPDEAFHAEMERRRRLISVCHPALRDSFGAELALAADQFLIVPEGRTGDAARARAAGDEIRTVIAGYHWFTDWGRDTMISLEGLTLATGRHADAGYILRTFAHYVRDGLIPNMFPEGKTDGLYHTADATLWFFHALQRYLDYTRDRATLRLLLPQLCQIVDCHLQGTRFGIGVDPRDGLLRQGAEGYQLTWMDAKVGDWVVTPRRGKAVEINALWYNALRLLEAWLREERSPEEAANIREHADRARDSFHRRFWYEQGQHLYDVVDTESGGEDASLRPNQLFAIALDHPVLERSRWKSVLEVVEQQLLTPVGLRSLAPGSPDYKPRYDGDLRARDAAYHQGTVWVWLIGPFIDAYLKLHPDDPQKARQFLEGFQRHLSEGCIGSASEIFDAEPPFDPRGCIAQAWSVAELVRCWVKTSGLAAEPGLSGLHFAGERAGK